jgi:hypothetical protein
MGISGAMKKIWPGALAGCLAGLAVAGEGRDLRTFSDTQGRAIQAKILAFNAGRGQLQIEREDGKKSWVGPGIFSESDQQYIKEWIVADRTLSDKNLKITFDKKKIDSFKTGMGDGFSTKKEAASKGDIVCYEVTLVNRSKEPVENLKIAYRYYVEVGGSGRNADTMRRIDPVKMTLERIDASGRTTFMTDEIAIAIHYDKIKILERVTRVFKGYEYKKLTEDRLLGIWIKIYGPPVDGAPSVRDVSYPEDLMEKVSWN